MLLRLSFLLSFLLSLYPTFILAQDSSNCSEKLKLFSSYQLYLNNKPVDSICLSNSQNRLNKYWGRIVIKEKDQKRKYIHGELWGFQQGEKLFRYFDEGKKWGGAYGYLELIEASGIYVFAFREKYSYFKGTYKTHYYYSKDLESTLKKLTVENLETDYPNPSFLEEVKGLKSLEEKDTNSALKINQIYKRYFP
jgi:hypothetical protein